jgi:hypothetical protein
MSGYILVSESGQVVPLPFHTQDFRGDPITVTGFEPGRTPESTGRIYTDCGAFYPSVCDLQIITEAEYMEKQS